MSIFQKASLPTNLSHLGLYLFAVSIPVSFVPAELGVVLAWLGWLLEGIFNKRWKFYSTNLYYPLLFYLIWNIISSGISPRPIHSLLALADNEWPLFIMLGMVILIDEVHVLKRMVHLWFYSAAGAALYGIWQTFAGVQLHRSDPLAPFGNYFRAVGFNGFYLTYAGLMMSVVLVSLCLGSQTGGKNRWKYLFLSVISSLAVVGTFARSIWLSFAVVLPVYGFTKGKRIGSIITIGFIALVLLGVLFVPAIQERAYSIFIPSENQTRLNLWKTSINISKDYPLTGIGEDNFDYYFERYRVEGFYDATGHPHNDYLNVLVNSGIPGLLAFLILWGVVLVKGKTVVQESKDPFLRAVTLGGSFAIIGFLVGGFFQNYYGTFANCWGWWFLAGMTMTSHRLHRRLSEFSG